MPTRVALHHETRYAFDRPVRLGPHVVRLRPAPHARTAVSGYTLTVQPDPHTLRWQQDPFGGFMARLLFPEKTRELRLAVDLVAELCAVNPFDFFVEPSAERFPFAYEPGLKRDLGPYLAVQPPTPRLSALLAELPDANESTVHWLVALNRTVYERIEYVTRTEPGVHTPEQALEAGRGSCRDSSWLLVSVLRHVKLAARFVSGYLVQLKGAEQPGEGGPTLERDVAALHAWAEVYLPGAGWIGLDPTSGLLTGEEHIPLAAGPRPASVAPVSGAVEPCRSELTYEMNVTRIDQGPA